MLFCYSGMFGHAVLWPSLPNGAIKKRKNCRSLTVPVIHTSVSRFPGVHGLLVCDIRNWIDCAQLPGFCVCQLKVDMPILTCIFCTFNWLTLTSEMHFVKFHPVVASCLLSRGKRKYAPLEMRLLWKYIRNYFLVYQLISPFLVYLQNYKDFEAEILDLQSEKYGLSAAFEIRHFFV